MIDPTNDVPSRWFAMRVTYRRELMVKQLLEDEKINCFIPMRYDIRKSGRQKKKELVPVIHNLIFVYTSPSRIQTVKKRIPCLQYMLDSRSGEKIVIPDKEMKRFIAVTGSYDEQLLYFKPEEVNWQKGTRVRIVGGEFEGMEGTFIKVKGARDRRVVICIQGLMAVAMATIHPDLIEPI
ncbi:MAG: UpxY family transcription antiterminator [Parabacteroides sp.]|nr:UpxY family transcription antiterminator [Parabacteroides sp.]